MKNRKHNSCLFMNFQSMPELTWKHGYAYVSLLSLAVVALLVIIGKKKKWF